MKMPRNTKWLHSDTALEYRETTLGYFLTIFFEKFWKTCRLKKSIPWVQVTAVVYPTRVIVRVELESARGFCPTEGFMCISMQIPPWGVVGGSPFNRRCQRAGFRERVLKINFPTYAPAKSPIKKYEQIKAFFSNLNSKSEHGKSCDDTGISRKVGMDGHQGFAEIDVRFVSSANALSSFQARDFTSWSLKVVVHATPNNNHNDFCTPVGKIQFLKQSTGPSSPCGCAQFQACPLAV